MKIIFFPSIIKSYKGVVLIVAIMFVSFCGTNKQAVLPENPLEAWETSQAKGFYQLTNLYNEFFTTMGIGSGTDYNEARDKAKLNAEFQLPEKVNLYLQTISVVTLDDAEVTSQAQASIKVRNIEYEELSRFQYQGKSYVAILAKKSRKKFFKEYAQLDLTQFDSGSERDFFKNAVESPSEGIDKEITSTDKEVKKWEEQQYLMAAKFRKEYGEDFTSFAISSGKTRETAKAKAEFYAALMLPEKVEMYIQTLTNVYAKQAGEQESDESLTQMQLNTIARSKKNIRNIAYMELGKLEHKGVIYVSAMALKSRKDFFDDYASQVDLSPDEKNDFFSSTNQKFNRMIEDGGY